MDITIFPKKLHGTVSAIASKSQAHRLLICAAFSNKQTRLDCPDTNQDIESTANCLRNLGAGIERDASSYLVNPIAEVPESAKLNCGESGSTLRFMLPIVGALGVDATFHMEGRLPYRPLSPLWEEMQRNGCKLSRPTEKTIRCTGKLKPGKYSIDGSVSSQFITGLLFAMAIMQGRSILTVTGKTESLPYIQMTQDALKLFGVKTDDYFVSGSLPFLTPGRITVEGDWSNGAFFLAANALGSSVDLTGLNPLSHQGDKAVLGILEQLDGCPIIDVSDIPDLVPVLAVAAGAKNGITFHNIARLRLKESDRAATVCEMLQQLGIASTLTENTLTVFPGSYKGCTIDSAGDHRIAMAAAVAATVASGPVTILGAQCVSKSYPSFWKEYHQLGGHYEQHIR